MHVPTVRGTILNYFNSKFELSLQILGRFFWGEGGMGEGVKITTGQKKYIFVITIEGSILCQMKLIVSQSLYREGSSNIY